MLRRIFCMMILANLGFGSVACGQSSAVAQLYGEGVHRYFARDYAGAEQFLSRAIEAGSQDPRAFYFRGLARSAYGGGGEFDYDEGARLEASGRVGANIGMALTRVQGYERAKIEKARQNARLFVQQQRELARQAIPALPAPSAPQFADPPAATDPFSGDGLRSDEVEFVPSPTTQPDAADDTSVDPFADEPTSPSSEPTSDGSMDDTDPFSDIPAEVADPVEDDPFGE